MSTLYKDDKKYFALFAQNWIDNCLTCVETPISVIQACLYGESTGTPKEELVTEVVTVTKKDLKAGEILDGGGGYTVHGVIERADVAREENLLPLGFAYDIPLIRDVPKDTPIAYGDVKVDTSGILYKLRQLQDANWIGSIIFLR